MAYQGYSDQPANSNPYGNPSPYGQAGNPYAETTTYEGGNPYAAGQYDARPHQSQQGDYEMSNMSNMNGSDPNRILNECRQVDNEVDQLEARQEQLRLTRRAYIDDTDTGAESQTGGAAKMQAERILAEYRGLVQRVKMIKSDKESGNPRNANQVGRLDRKVKASLNKFQQYDSEYNRQLKDRMARDYRIVQPDASDAEVEEYIQSGNQQVFSQALLNSDRRGQAQSTAQNVKERHLALQQIEKDMIMIAALFQDLDTLVVQQEAQVTRIEATGEEVLDNTTKANTELDGAVTKARAARKKKWMCLGIAVLILLIIIIIIVVVVVVKKKA